MYGKVKVLVVQSYVLCVSPYSLCDHMDCSPPDSVHGIFQARILVWVAIPFSRGSSWLGIKFGFLALQMDSLPSEPPGKLLYIYMYMYKYIYVYMYVYVCVYIYMYIYIYRKNLSLPDPFVLPIDLCVILLGVTLLY